MLGSYWIFVLNIWNSEVNISERTLVFESRIKKDFSAVASLFFPCLWLLFQDLVNLMWITTSWNQYNYCITAEITRWRFPMNLDLNVTTTALPYFSFYENCVPTTVHLLFLKYSPCLECYVPFQVAKSRSSFNHICSPKVSFNDPPRRRLLPPGGPSTGSMLCLDGHWRSALLCLVVKSNFSHSLHLQVDHIFLHTQYILDAHRAGNKM